MKQTMSVSWALSLMETVVIDHHDIFFHNIYDFAKALVVRCSVDPEYVLANMYDIVDKACYGNFDEAVMEVESHVMDLSEEQVAEFCSKLNSIIEKQRIAEAQLEEKNSEIKKAKERYGQLGKIARLCYLIKDGKPTDDNLDDKSTEEIKKMYTKRRVKC